MGNSLNMYTCGYTKAISNCSGKVSTSNAHLSSLGTWKKISIDVFVVVLGTALCAGNGHCVCPAYHLRTPLFCICEHDGTSGERHRAGGPSGLAMHHERYIPSADPSSVFLRVSWWIPHVLQVGVTRKKAVGFWRTGWHLLRSHHDALQPGNGGRTYYQSEHCVWRRTTHWCGRVSGVWEYSG